MLSDYCKYLYGFLCVVFILQTIISNSVNILCTTYCDGNVPSIICLIITHLSCSTRSRTFLTFSWWMTVIGARLTSRDCIPHLNSWHHFIYPSIKQKCHMLLTQDIYQFQYNTRKSYVSNRLDVTSSTGLRNFIKIVASPRYHKVSFEEVKLLVPRMTLITS